MEFELMTSTMSLVDFDVTCASWESERLVLVLVWQKKLVFSFMEKDGERLEMLRTMKGYISGYTIRIIQ